MQCCMNKNSAVFQMHSVHFQVLFSSLFGPLCYEYAPGVARVCVILGGVTGLRICISNLCSENDHLVSLDFSIRKSFGVDKLTGRAPVCCSQCFCFFPSTKPGGNRSVLGKAS